MADEISDEERKHISDRWAAVITQMSRYDLITPSQIRESMKNYQLIIDDSRYYESNPSDDKRDQSFYVDWYMKNLVTPSEAARKTAKMYGLFQLPKLPVNSDDTDPAMQIDSVKVAKTRKAERARKFVNGKRARIGMRPVPFDWTEDDVIHCAEFEYHWKDEK